MSGRRSIFEEVGEAERPRTSTGVIDRARRGSRTGLRLWLVALFALVVVMIAVGGLTRLTDSGLSITEWAPFRGAVPPMGAAAWEAEFARYREIPEFQVQNSWMGLEEFKRIYWWEWSHRQLGRVIGLVWALGYLAFWAMGKVPPGWHPRLLVVGGLGGLQGAIGWWMVSSGLAGTQLDVASYRLAVHLGVAFVILGMLAWYVFLLGRAERDLMQARRVKERRVFGMATGWLHVVFLQILIGALVAGIDAGRSYTDWPTIGGGWLPPEPFLLEPAWRNWLENPGLVQFVHRVVGYFVLIFGIAAWLRGRRSAHRATRRAFHAAGVALVAQIAIGIATVITGAPWQVAILHQLMAVALWVLILRARFLAAYPVVTTIRGV